MLLAMLMAVVGCSREESSDAGMATEAISFSAATLSRGVVIKDSWSVGDLIAIFIADADGVYSGTPYCYRVTTSSGELEATSDRIYNDGVSTSFCAFYPYDSDLSSYTEYIDRQMVMDATVDYLCCGTTSLLSGGVNFLFSHIYSMLSFDFSWGYEYDSSDSFTSTLTIDSQEYILDVEQMSASMFVTPTSELGSVTLTTVVTSIEPNRTYVSDLTSVSEISEWVMGEEHLYNNIVVGTADLLYNVSTLEYEIYTVSGLQAFADLVNGESNSSGATVSLAVNNFGEANPQINGRLMNSLDLSTVCSSVLGVSWTPIGSSESCSYAGVFDGNNKFISKLYINDPFGDGLGLFGYLSGAEVSNLSIINSSVTGRNYYTGGLAAYAGGASIIKCCYYQGEVTGGYIVGGILGQSNNSTVVSCYSTGTVTAFTNYVGGLIGQVDIGGAMLFGCYSGADVSCLNVGADEGGLIGEIISGATIVLYDCYFWYGDDASLVGVGDVNGTLNTLQVGYSLEELNSDSCVDSLNSGVDYWCSRSSVDNVVNYIYEVGSTTPELILKR